MQAFLNTARVQVDEEGLYFYERDILMSSYLFNRDVKVDINLSYNRSGFGIVISEDSCTDPKHSYLYHLGTNDFIVYEKHLLKQTEHSSRTNTVSPGKDIHLLFTLEKKKGRLYLISQDDDGKEAKVMIGEHVISRQFSTYYIGIYSQAGNKINDITFLQGIPDKWNCSIANVHGGRISFWDDGFMFEDCIRDAELEQKEIMLPAGRYWLDYKTSAVNDEYDIEGFVYANDIPKPPSDTDDRYYQKERDHYDETYLEDQGKMLVHNQGYFVLTEPAKVIVSFKGHNGRVDYVCLKDTFESDYLSTGSDIRSIDGSWITVNLTNVIAVKWEGIIFSVPSYESASTVSPWSIISTATDKVQMGSLSVELNKQYDYYYNVETSILSVTESNSELASVTRNINLTEADDSTIKIFSGVNAQITNLTLIMVDGQETNINVQRTYKVFVPGYIKGPVIVTDINKNAFDLSGSYREVVDGDNYTIDLFSKESFEFKLSHHTSILWSPVEVYGISKGAIIDKTKTDISLFSSQYQKISEDLISVQNDVVIIPDEVKNDYDYFAVRYQKVDSFNYVMTVYGRELFEGTENILKLSSDINESGQGITVYGIYKGCLIEKYILRVPDKGMLNAIDICASHYDMISPMLYEVSTTENLIRLNSSLSDTYEYYIVDYLKRNSFAVNWNEQGQQYEVDISSDESTMEVHYEMDDNGNSSDIIRTEIYPTTNKFIILKRKKEEDFE